MIKLSAETKVAGGQFEKERKLANALWRDIRRNRLAFFGLVVLIAMTAIAVLAPLIAPYDPFDGDPANRFMAPSIQHPLGTDELGRDIMTRIIYGARASLTVGVLAVSITLLLGTPLGLTSGYVRGIPDYFIMRSVEALLSFPPILLALALVAAFGPGISNVVIALGIVFTPQLARLTRGEALAIREEKFVMGARALGLGELRIVSRYILPNILGPIMVYATSAFAYAIIAEATLSFLGLGISPPNPSWGLMIKVGRDYLQDAPWMAVFPGVVLSICVLGINFFGDGLRDALDPYLRHR